MPITKVHSSLGSANSGSSNRLVNYLQKENDELDKLAKEAQSKEHVLQIEARKMGFFSHQEKQITALEVEIRIDANKRKLGKNDAKFFSPTINFSKAELQHLSLLATKGREVKNVWEMNLKEYQTFNNSIVQYSRQIMNNYAKNFNRENKGLKDGEDLLYFGKVEHNRKYKGTDLEVKKGLAKSGQDKPGFQSHVHIIVSRKSKDQRLKLSPTANEKNTTRRIGENDYRVGFDRKKWIQANERSFDQLFAYDRTELEKFQNQNILKNGSPHEKGELSKRIEKEKNKEISNNVSLEL